jgi:hypothetical protein
MEGRREARCLSEKCIPSSKAFPSSRIWTAVSHGGQTSGEYGLPPRIPCTDRRRRPGRWATRGTLLASPWCFRAQCRCRCVAAVGVAAETLVGRRRRVRWNRRAQVRRTVCSQHCRQPVNSPDVVRKSSLRDGELCDLRPRARTPTNRHGRQRQARAQTQAAEE